MPATERVRLAEFDTVGIRTIIRICIQTGRKMRQFPSAQPDQAATGRARPCYANVVQPK